MGPQFAGREDDLSGVERRLAGWQPVTGPADDVVFAAGFSAGRRGRRLVQTACVVLAAGAAGLGVWGLAERAERLAVEAQLRAAGTTGPTAPAAAEPAPLEPVYPPSPDGYFHLRREVGEDPDRWLAPPQVGSPPPGPPAEVPGLRAGRRDALPDL
jgi:hypothetical protein